jgi:hypothetical protein
LKSSVSRRFDALTRAQLTTWLAQPLDGLDVRIILPSGLGWCSCGDTDVGCAGLSLPCTGFVCNIQLSGCGCTMP